MVVEGLEGATQRMGSAIAQQRLVIDLGVCSARRRRLAAKKIITRALFGCGRL